MQESQHPPSEGAQVVHVAVQSQPGGQGLTLPVRVRVRQAPLETRDRAPGYRNGHWAGGGAGGAGPRGGQGQSSVEQS